MNQHIDPRDLNETEARIIDAAIFTVLKFGPKKTTMNDIAEAAGLTRQTVYVSFGGKDKVLAEMVHYIGRRHLTQVGIAWEYCPNLAEKLKAYARIVVLETYDEMTEDEDPQELVGRHNAAGRSAYLDVREKHVAMWSEQLAQYKDVLDQAGVSANRLARFIVTTSFNLKRSEDDRGKRHDQLDVLQSAVLAILGRK